MIMLKTAEKEDFLDLAKLIEAEGIQVPAGFPEGMEVVVAREKDKVLGFVSAELVVLDPYVRCLYMLPALRGRKFADGLLRALLYYMLNRGFGFAYAEKDTLISSYLEGFGFKNDEKQEGRLALEIDPFFDQGCQGCAGSKAPVQL
jgi:GNAT superfamily N-acetyltransferase